MPVPCTVAWVESPLQLLGALEHAARTVDERERPLAILPRAGDAQLERTASHLHDRGLPEAVGIGLDRDHRGGRARHPVPRARRLRGG